MQLITRIHLLLITVVFTLPPIGTNIAAEQKGNERSTRSAQPNIVFIFSDDHAYQAIGTYGSKINKTPNIDRIARQGMRFDRCLVTNSICGPCRAVIQTGKYSHLNGFLSNGNRFDGSQQTFPKLMQKAGFQTAVIGKWHLRTDPTGFDHWFVLPGQGHYYNPDFRTPEGKVRIEGYVTDVITDKAMDWLDKGRDEDKPFVLMLQHKAPHREWLAGPDHLNMFDDQQIAEPETLMDSYAGRPDVVKGQEMTIANHMRSGYDLKVWLDKDRVTKPYQRFFSRMNDEQRENYQKAYAEKNKAFVEAKLEGDELIKWKYQRYIKDYLRSIASVDDNVGRVLDYLDRSGLSENTVVIYSSDQGFYLGEHGWYDKRWIFEESLRAPLVVRWPGVIEPGTSNSNLVSNLDFAQTFLNIAGIEEPDDMQGRSLVPLMKGESVDDWRKSFYYHYYEISTHKVPAHEGVVTDRHKLVHYYRTRDGNKPRDIDEWELLDLKLNPQETKSYYDAESHAGFRTGLEDELAKLRKKYKVPSDTN